MTVYPLKFQLGPLMITGFGLMMMVGFLMAGWVLQRQLKSRDLSPVYAEHLIIATVIGGIIGAKLWFVILRQDPSSLFSRGGLVWYGGFLGGTVAVLIAGWRARVPTRFTLEIAAPAVALGHALGRVGCFLVQDDYGIPTTLPWGMRFPEGYPASTAGNLRELGVAVPPDALPTDVLAVHPTQLYEVVALLFIFWLLWRLRRHRHGTGWLLAVYLIANALERFLVEFIRAKDDRLLGALTLAQVTSVAALVVGLALFVAWWQKDELSLPGAAKVLRKEPA